MTTSPANYTTCLHGGVRGRSPRETVANYYDQGSPKRSQNVQISNVNALSQISPSACGRSGQIPKAAPYGSARKSELEDLRCCAKKMQVISHGGTTSTKCDCAENVAIFLRTASISGWCTFRRFCAAHVKHRAKINGSSS